MASRGFGTPALAVFGAGLIALPLLVSALVWAAAAGIRLERRIEPARVEHMRPAGRVGLQRLVKLCREAHHR